VVVRAPQIRLYHPAVEGSGPGYAAKAFGYGRGRIALLRKHRFSWWFRLGNLFFPLVSSLWSAAAVRRFRWHLFRGRWHEWFHPHGETPEKTEDPGAVDGKALIR